MVNLSFNKLIDALWLPLLPLLAVGISPFILPLTGYKMPTSIPVLIPLAGAVVCVLLGWRFHKSRAVFVAILTFIAFVVFTNNEIIADFSSQQNRALAQLAILLLPINMLIYALLPERSLINRYGLILALVLAVQFVFCYWAVVDQSSGALNVLISAIDYRFLPVAGQSAPLLSDILICLYAVVFLLLLGRAALWGEVLEGAIFISALSLALASHGFMAGSNVELILTAAILAVALAVMQDSYRMAFIDELTGIPGRRALMDNFKSLGSQYAIAMSDIDHFKKFNDTYGHDVGDEVLRMVASRLNQVKGGGKAFRYGGEEFTIVFPGKTAKEAFPYLDDIREIVEDSAFTLRSEARPKTKGKKQRSQKAGAKDVSVTVSIGVADSDKHGRAADVVMKAADKALYRAKNAGRNKVVR